MRQGILRDLLYFLAPNLVIVAILLVVRIVEALSIFVRPGEGRHLCQSLGMEGRTGRVAHRLPPL